MSTEQATRLLRLKEEIEQKKEEYNEAMGELKALKARLKKEFDVDSLEEATKKSLIWEKELAETEKALSTQLDNIEEALCETE